MPLGFSIIGSTVTFDLFLRWATQGPLGPLVYLNIFFSETAHWILTKLHRNDPWVVSYQNFANRSSWLHKLVMGSINRFLNETFKNILVWNYKAQIVLIWHIASSRGPLPQLFKLFPWGSLLLAPLWPLTFFSGERPRALWALLFMFR